jgi:CheY-like chemotaxis protein
VHRAGAGMVLLDLSMPIMSGYNQFGLDAAASLSSAEEGTQ